ncbi:MAG: dihydrofolate reductase [Bacteroidales bacterium]|nr:dihydrofolate reductase [Bacteroidales bacterium]
MIRLSIIAAIDKNNAIGYKNDLLCYLPADLKHFKELTTGHSIVMGRKTFESLPKGALPNRKNIVLTRNKDFNCLNCTIIHSVDELYNLEHDKEEIFIIGGAQIYKLFINKADKLYLTHIHHEFEADTFFPELNQKDWEITKQEDFEADEKNKYRFSFVTYQRSS